MGVIVSLRASCYIKHYRVCLSVWLHGIRRGIRNLIAYAPIIWRDRDFDWGFLAELMEFKLRRMCKSSEHWCHTGAEDCRKEMTLCVNLLKRIREEDYPMDSVYARHEGKKVPHWVYLQEQDERLLFETMRKHWRSWWD